MIDIIDKITITVGDNDYEAVMEEGMMDETCSECSLCDKCLNDSKLCHFCVALEKLNPNFGVYFKEKNVAEGF